MIVQMIDQISPLLIRPNVRLRHRLYRLYFYLRLYFFGLVLAQILQNSLLFLKIQDVSIEGTIHDILAEEILRQGVFEPVEGAFAFAALEESFLEQLLLRGDIIDVLIWVVQGARAREIKGSLAVERFLREVGVAILVVEPDLPVILLKTILKVVVLNAVRRGIDVVIVEMLSTERFWVDFLLLKTRFLLFLNFPSFTHLFLYLTSFHRRIRFFLAGLLFRFPTALLPKLAEAVLKAMLGGLSPVVSPFVALCGSFPASDRVNGELLVGD